MNTAITTIQEHPYDVLVVRIVLVDTERIVVTKDTTPLWFSECTVDTSAFEHLLKGLRRDFIVKRIYKEVYIADYDTYESGGVAPVEIIYEVGKVTAT